ncbi:TonB-dependent receptor [Marinifilum fragile]|uniref:TonB-dependent receptor n=1 Tax=Marinifilum fragile TaxID=570161 RepID=UPI002AAC067F|nr:TonB-dependent receptor [Marinifilum fragile]
MKKNCVTGSGERVFTPLRKILLTMKLSVFLFLLGIISVQANELFSQTSLSMQMKSASVEKVLEEIKQQCDYDFIYDYEYVKELEDVTIECKGASLDEVLYELLKNTSLDYRVEDKMIVLYPREVVKQKVDEKVDTSVQQEKKTIKGKVTDEQGVPLPGVSVVIKGTNVGVATDIDGNYSIQFDNEKAVLVFSFVGMTTQEIAYSGQFEINVVLNYDSEGLDEVIIVGYGTQTKEKLVGSVVTVGSDQLEKQTALRVSESLNGLLPGITTFKEAGGPGRGSEIFIRGISTTGDNSPLIVVDGIPDRSIDNLDPNEIESISVLKDAASAAVYGARAANGVVLVTTKQGQKGKTKFSFKTNYSIKQPNRLLKPASSSEYAELLNEAYKNEGSYNPALGKGYTAEEVQKFKDGSDPDRYPNTDWYDEVFDPTCDQLQTNLSASGGSDRIKYFFSGGFSNENGFYELVNHKRFNLRSNIEAKLTDNLTINVNLGGNKVKHKDASSYNMDGIHMYILTSPSVEPNRLSNGGYNYVPDVRGNIAAIANGENGQSRSESDNFSSDITLQYDVPFMKGLSLKGKFAYDKMAYLSQNLMKPYYTYIPTETGFNEITAYPQKPELSNSTANSNNETWEVSMNYNKTFGLHSFESLFLYSQNKYVYQSFSAKRKDFVTDLLPVLNMGDPTTATNSGSASYSTRKGWVGRLKYDYSSKYFLEATFRYDGSDKFPKGERFGFFPSIAGAWAISQEDFWGDSFSFIDYAKIKASWGMLGNDRVKAYQHMSTYSTPQYWQNPAYSFGGTSPESFNTLREDLLPNSLITWEKAIVVNVGLQAGLFNDHLDLEIDYFKKRTRDILVPRSAQIPGTVGIGLPMENIGEVENSGLEVMMKYKDKIGDFRFYISPNFAINKNKVIKFPEAENIPDYQRKEGNEVAFDAFLGYVAEGLFQSQEEIDNSPTMRYAVQPGDIKYKDLNDDGTIDYMDRKFIGKGFPSINYGLNIGCSYKGLELSMNWQGAADVKKHYLGVSKAFGSGYTFPSAVHKDHWTPENRDATFPRMWVNDTNNTFGSTYWLKDASYFRMKNIQLAYSLPQKMVKGLGVSDAKIAVSGTNLITLTSLKHFDPEAGTSFQYPLEKAYNFSLTVNF